jgi:hypothetical protein
MDRANASEALGRGFESLRARQFFAASFEGVPTPPSPSASTIFQIILSIGHLLRAAAPLARFQP